MGRVNLQDDLTLMTILLGRSSSVMKAWTGVISLPSNFSCVKAVDSSKCTRAPASETSDEGELWIGRALRRRRGCCIVPAY